MFHNLKRLLALMWHEDKRLLLAYFSTAIVGALLLYVVFFSYKVMIDQVAGTQSLTAFTSMELVIITYLFFEYLSRFVNYTFNNYYFDYVIRAKFQNLLSRRFFKKLAALDFAQLEAGDTRNLIAKVQNSYDSRLPDMLTKVNAIIYNVSALLFSLIIALRFDLRYFLVLALVAVPIYYLRAKYGNVAWNNYSANAPKTNYLNYIKYLFTNFTTLHEIKIYGLASHLLSKTEKLQTEILEDYKEPIKRYSMLSTISFLLIPTAIYFSLTRFIHHINLGFYTIGDFTLFLNALFTFSGQISGTLVNIGALYENNLYASDYFSLQDIQPKLLITPDPITITAPQHIEFQDVTFRYPGALKPSVNHLNFTIKKGQNIALVGKNGAGKSTLVKLLLRFYAPTSGKILVDGHDLSRIPLDNWYQQLGILFQDFARYFVSLKENIHFGNLHHYDEVRLKEAFHDAQGEDILGNLPQGYEQILGRWFDSGIELSGGQWQKVAIARAIYRNAPILILDEPTSAIDAETEAAIFNNLHSLYHDKTLLFISHRFSTVRTADKILVMKSGCLTETGTHTELMKEGGLYAHYFSLQQRGYQ